MTQKTAFAGFGKVVHNATPGSGLAELREELLSMRDDLLHMLGPVYLVLRTFVSQTVCEILSSNFFHQRAFHGSPAWPSLWKFGLGHGPAEFRQVPQQPFSFLGSGQQAGVAPRFEVLHGALATVAGK